MTNKQRFSSAALDRLLVCGWFTGRDATDCLTPSPYRVVVPAAAKVLAEFGLLNITFFDEKNVDFENTLDLGRPPDAFDIVALNIGNDYEELKRMAALSDERMWEEVKRRQITETTLLERELGKKCTVVGTMEDAFHQDGREIVIVAETGEVYLFAYEPKKAADSFDEFLNGWINPKKERYYNRFGGKYNV